MKRTDAEQSRDKKEGTLLLMVVRLDSKHSALLSNLTMVDLNYTNKEGVLQVDELVFSL